MAMTPFQFGNRKALLACGCPMLFFATPMPEKSAASAILASQPCNDGGAIFAAIGKPLHKRVLAQANGWHGHCDYDLAAGFPEDELTRHIKQL